MRTRLILIFFLTFAAIYVLLPPISVPGTYTVPYVNYTITPQNFFHNFPLRLGLDLQGGTQLVLEADMSKLPPEDKDNALDSAREVIDRRVNLYGVSEAVVQSSKVGDSRRILVDLPGVKDTEQAQELVGRTAQL
jgi:preprotein translocase subunit SecD